MASDMSSKERTAVFLPPFSPSFPTACQTFPTLKWSMSKISDTPSTGCFLFWFSPPWLKILGEGRAHSRQEKGAQKIKTGKAFQFSMTMPLAETSLPLHLYVPIPVCAMAMMSLATTNHLSPPINPANYFVSKWKHARTLSPTKVKSKLPTIWWKSQSLA